MRIIVPSIFLETTGLYLKAPHEADFPAICSLQSHPAIMQHFIQPHAQIRKTFDLSIQHYRNHGFTLFSVFEKITDTFIGQAGLIHLAYDDTQPDIELVYQLLPTARGLEYATELANALIAWAWQHQSIQKIITVIHQDNIPSRHVAEKVGMHYVGKACYTHHPEGVTYAIDKRSLQLDKVTLVPATLQDYPIMQNMGRFYLYDMSEYLGISEKWTLPSDGLYTCIDFKKYWETDNTSPFLVYYEKEVAGFVIVDKKTYSSNADFNMAQFFILRKFKRHGLGRHVAQTMFSRYPGTWEVMVLPGNEGAYRFWRNIITEHTNSNFQETTCEVPHFQYDTRNIFTFYKSP